MTMTMTPAEVIEEMRIISTEPLSESVVRWADALERAMREPVAYLSKTLDSHGNVRSRELSWVPIPSTSPLNLDRINHQLFMLPPDAAAEIERLTKDNARLRGMADEFRALMVKVDQLDEKDAEIERLKAEVEWLRLSGSDLHGRVRAVGPDRFRIACDPDERADGWIAIDALAGKEGKP